LLKNEKSLKLKLKLQCQTLPDARTFNVVGELRGTEKPEEIIVIGGHLDAWDVGQGAHDDGAGCIQSIEALRLLKELGLKPKRTIRAVMFANEENGLRGGTAYAKVNRPGEKHIAAIESDMGGFMPRGFTVQGTPEQVQKVARFAPLFEVIEADRIRTGGGGSDISPLAAMGVPAIGLRCDAQRYFKYHHCETDVIEAVNDRELQLGACALAILAYALAMEGM
jgi:Zn-dependent M28 family amino/carboxypeptidase